MISAHLGAVYDGARASQNIAWVTKETANNNNLLHFVLSRRHATFRRLLLKLWLFARKI